MILKLLLVIGVIGIVYFFFIKKKPLKQKNKTPKNEEKQQSSDMVECSYCGTYAEYGESILSNNKYYCCNECVDSIMLIYGHRFIPSESFYHIVSIDAIQNTPPSSTIFLPFDEKNLDIINHLINNNINFALEIQTISEVIYASSLGAKFIVIPKELTSTIQNIANNYLFDSKILTILESENDIEEMARLGVDGIIFSNAIIKINS